MNAADALEMMLSESGNTKGGLSVKMGKHRNFLHASLARGPWNPELNTLMSAAALCGWSVQLSKDGRTVTLD